VLGDAGQLAEAGPGAVGEGPPWYPRSGPAGFGRGRARQAPPLSTVTGAENGRLRPASWPPVDMVLATEGWEFHLGQRGHIAAGQRRMAAAVAAARDGEWEGTASELLKELRPKDDQALRLAS
jgi:hypothetical protein